MTDAELERIEAEAWADQWGYDRRQELRAIIALWGPAIRHRPRDSRKGWTIYDGYERNREEEWTVWRALVCTIAILLGRRWGDDAEARWSRRHGRAGVWADTPRLAFFDSRDTYGGYDITRVELAPGCRFSVFSDGECLM
ncbi:hypothetical protein KZ810_13215 [Sphingomonas sp. RHCKR47]|uniref:hypothetical protein n=1 Tax=Sphingomonas citricola TaxID=2862498 RepID=UPI001CA5CE47|nr:hypothetical protein [Sphingomonas citricola]MBW6524462.1 hypothetical protein [Sphingomonas citricola]